MFAKIYALIAPIVNWLDDFLTQASNWVNAISLIVAMVTLVTMLRFKRRIRVDSEQKEFQRKRNRIIKDLNGFTGSLLEDPATYVTEFLETIDIYLLELAGSYTIL